MYRQLLGAQGAGWRPGLKLHMQQSNWHSNVDTLERSNQHMRFHITSFVFEVKRRRPGQISVCNWERALDGQSGPDQFSAYNAEDELLGPGSDSHRKSRLSLVAVLAVYCRPHNEPLNLSRSGTLGTWPGVNR